MIGCDAAILAAADAGQLELNVMMPVIAWNALHATRDPHATPCACWTDRCVAGIRADEARCRELLDRSTALATALSPYIGYAETADIAKTPVATGRSIRDLVRERNFCPTTQLDAILSADAMTTPGVPGEIQDAGCTAETLWRRRDGAGYLPLAPRSPPSSGSTADCFRRRISACSRAPTATRGSARSRSWTPSDRGGKRRR